MTQVTGEQLEMEWYRYITKFAEDWSFDEQPDMLFDFFAKRINEEQVNRG